MCIFVCKAYNMADWRNNIQEIAKIYIRFLKDNGIFKRALELHYTHNCGIAVGGGNCDVLLKTLRYTDYPFQFIHDSATFCIWRDTEEGEDYWWIKSLLWGIECLENESIRKLLSMEAVGENVRYLISSWRIFNSKTHNNKFNKKTKNILKFLDEYIKELQYGKRN